MGYRIQPLTSGISAKGSFWLINMSKNQTNKKKTNHKKPQHTKNNHRDKGADLALMKNGKKNPKHFVLGENTLNLRCVHSQSTYLCHFFV